MKTKILTLLICLIFNFNSRSLFSSNVLTESNIYSVVMLPKPPPVKIQIAILFDTSNSMDGLIDQAKSRIWKIVNEMTGLTYNGQTPDIEFALYDYGNQTLSSSSNFIRQQTPFTNDLDFLSQKLFALRTNGGDEFCGAVIERSIMDLEWSFNDNDLKMIYIAGNEPFNQGPVDYKSVCKLASSKKIFVNTIFCGPYDLGVQTFWKDGSDCSDGDYFNINSDKRVVHIPTPYDNEIRSYNDSLNTTYIGYGSRGRRKMKMQISQDNNAASQAGAVAVERSIVKSKKSYNNSTWDIVDAVEEEGEEMLDELKEEDLPKELKGMSDKEIKKYIDNKKQKRTYYQKNISELAKKRELFISEEMKKKSINSEEDDFGTAVSKSIKERAKKLGYQ